jgi:hypothetical protein
MNSTAHTAALVALAEQFDAACVAANAIEATAWQMHAYGDASNGLLKVLALLCGNQKRADLAYQAILDGNTVREALRYVRTETGHYIAVPDDAPVAAEPDHRFRVVDGRTSRVVLETASWHEAADCQYDNNRQETAVGYDPCFSLWVLDNDGNTTRIQSQL